MVKPKQRTKKGDSLYPAQDLSRSEVTVEGNEKRWFVIHTYSGYEERVRKNLEQRIKLMDSQDSIFQVVIPTEEEIEVKNGQRRSVTKKILPSYVLVQMEMNDHSWNVVRNTPGVTGFVGSGGKPTPLQEEEIGQILKQMTAEAPKVKVGFRKGQSIRVTDGPFIDFVGVVDEIKAEKGKVKVLLSLFGRETPVELDFLQVEKL
ncbi:MAG TPA: transcription termination/antitermination protein NusG [Dehalococcoidia bacterium]|nr:transcription termination/antitermination protein NusG [Dehalococcoidia bacterium]